MSFANWFFGKKKLARTRRAEATRRKFLGNAVENLEGRAMMAVAPINVVPTTTALTPIAVTTGTLTFNAANSTLISTSDADGDGVGGVTAADWKSTRLNSSHLARSRMPSSA